MYTNKEINTFFELVRAGLWGREVQLSQYKDIDYAAIMRLAEEQAVVGLVTAGLEHVIDVKVPQEWILQFVGNTLQIEQQNKDMNEFLACLIEQLRKEDVYAILVKGQGIAQCYERPLWRTCGDVDLLLDDVNYEKAKQVLLPFAMETEPEFKSLKHLGMTLRGGFVVELHGMLHSRLSRRVDKLIDEVQRDVFFKGNVRAWQLGNTPVFLPSPDNDVFFIFTHILKHFYIEGIGLRQICDWCRLLWTYRDSLNQELLKKRLCKAGLMTEWKAFAAFAVEYLGMPIEAMPVLKFRDESLEFRDRLQDKEFRKYKRKADRIMEFVMEAGNFGHNRVFNRSQNYLIGKAQALCFKLRDFVRHARIFPLDSMTFFLHYFMNGIMIAKEIKQREN